MVDDDTLLIHRILSGEEAAFSTLVEKYQRGVHAFVWKKIGDFHFAEEITQDTFVQVYENLSTLRNPSLFAGWLYVIANRLCIKWKQKRKSTSQSLECTSMSEIDLTSYNKYTSEQRDIVAIERRLEIVDKLLKKLPESERTVMTLHYLGEMTVKEVSLFLGVSVNTIKSRLHRARERLKSEEAILRESLSSLQFPTHTTENIMRKISQLKPNAPSGIKQLVPIGISAGSAIIVLLLIGVSGMYIHRFQKPYSLESTSEETIEIIDAQLVREFPAERVAQTQVGRSDVIGRNDGPEQRQDTPLFGAEQTNDTMASHLDLEWTQTKGPEGGAISTLFTTARGDIFAGTLNGLYRLTNDRATWQLINDSIKGPSLPLYENVWWWPVAEKGGRLYLATDTEILVSTDRGETWETLCEGVEKNMGHLVGMILTEGERGAEMTIYLAYKFGVFRSDDIGKTWTLLFDGLIGTNIRTITKIQDTIFAGTHKGLYRLNDNIWEQVSIDKEKFQDKLLDIPSVAVTENHIYVAARIVERSDATEIGLDQKLVELKLRQPSWSLYHSDDMGNTWNNITPKLDTTNRKNYSLRNYSASIYRTVVLESPPIRLAASGENVLVVVGKYHSYSTDVGQTWTHLKDIGDVNDVSAVVLLNDSTIYRSGLTGIHQTTKDDESWQNFNIGIINTFIHQLIILNNTVFAYIDELRVVNSTDSGETWMPVAGDPDEYTRILEFDGTLYAMSDIDSSLNLFRFSHEENRFIEIPNVPAIDKTDAQKPSTIIMETHKFGGEEKVKTDIYFQQKGDIAIDTIDNSLTFRDYDVNTKLFMVSSFKSFAVSDTAYYVEFDQKLFRWKPGTTKWYDTGLKDESEFELSTNSKDFFDAFSFGLKLAVLKNTVYVGTQDGRLMQSFDEGDTWNDVTTYLPLPVKGFEEIVFVGKTVYVATDKGVVSSMDGNDWHVITDTQGEILVVDSFAVDKSMVYGLSEQRVYKLSKKSNTWQQMTPKIAHSISAFEVDGNTVYVGTKGQGVFRFTLDDSKKR